MDDKSMCEGGSGPGICFVHRDKDSVRPLRRKPFVEPLTVEEIRMSGKAVVVYDLDYFDRTSKWDPLCSIPIPLAPYNHPGCTVENKFHVPVGRKLPNGTDLGKDVGEYIGNIFARQLNGSVSVFFRNVSVDGCFLNGRYFQRGMIELWPDDRIEFGKQMESLLCPQYRVCIEDSKTI